MRNFLRKYCIKVPLLVVGSAAALFLVSSIIGSVLILKYKDALEFDVSSYLGNKVSIGQIFYIPPHFVVLRNTSIFKGTSSESGRLIFAKTIKLSLWVAEFLRNRNLTVKGVYVSGIRADYFEGMQFLKEKIDGIAKDSGPLPNLRNMTLAINDASLKLSEKDGRKEYLVFGVNLRLENESVLCRGSINLEYFSGKNKRIGSLWPLDEPLAYSLKGYLNQKGLSIENLSLKQEKSYVRLWGALERQALTLNGFSTIRGLFSEKESDEFSPGIIDQFKSTLRRLRTSPLIIKSPASGLNIYDISCLIKFNFPEVKIENIGFWLKTTPFALGGKVVLSSPFVIDLKFSSFPKLEGKDRLKNSDSYDVEAIGTLQGGIFNGNLNVNFVSMPETGPQLDKIQNVLKNVTFHSMGGSRLKLFIKEAEVAYERGEKTYELFLVDFDAILNFKDRRYKFVEFSSNLYDGFLKGVGRVDTDASPLEWIFDIKLDDVSPTKLSSIIYYLSHVNGSLSGNVHYQTYPKQTVYGKIVVDDGFLEDIDFFDWLSKFFKIPSLKEIDFDRGAAEFLVNEGVSQVENININSQDVNISGYFRLSDNDLISSKLSMSLSREILETSPRFKSLLKLLGKQFTSLEFDFQLSGLADDMNFKWLDSLFRERLKARIPDFIERGIERRVEDLAGSAGPEEDAHGQEKGDSK